MVKIIRRNPFGNIEQFFNDQDFWGFVPAVRRSMEPAMDLYMTDKDVVAEMQVPNIDPSKINVSVEENMLKVEGSTREEKEEGEQGKEYYRKEIRSGSFSRMISLPVAVKEDEAKATYENGVLKITIPKAEVKQPKKVEIRVN